MRDPVFSSWVTFLEDIGVPQVLHLQLPSDSRLSRGPLLRNLLFEATNLNTLGSGLVGSHSGAY